ncbi:MAG: hypothetical protein KME30_15975 [Iphinoe sp. HA4291-MV1]|nr:hypothetical protein [Iphinoe sp. HA4291-MV1]
MVQFDEAVANANQRLKAAKARVLIEKRCDRLCLRATLPPKPHTGKGRAFRQRISLGAKATIAGLQYAEQKAKLISAQLDLDKFDWAEWIEQEPSQEDTTIGEWVERFEEDYWNRVSRTPNKEENWKKDYAQVFSKLPAEKPLTLDSLLTCIKSTPNGWYIIHRRC